MNIYHTIRMRNGVLLKLPTSIPENLLPFIDGLDWKKFKQFVDDKQALGINEQK